MSFDILLDSNRDIPQNTQHVRGLEIVAQRVETRLRTFIGEWIADQTKGLPVLEWLAQKPPDVATIGAFVRKEIESTPGVRKVENFETTFEPTSRKITFVGDVVVDDEQEPLNILFAPFGPVEAAGNTSPMIVFTTRSGAILGGF